MHARSPRRTLWQCLCVGALALAIVAARAADARAGLPGSPFLATGITDDQSYQYSSSRDQWFSRAQALGATSVRIGVTWSVVAPDPQRPGFNARNPSDPQYNFAQLDAAVRSATAHHQLVMLVVFNAPHWAEGPGRPNSSAVGPGSWYPNPSALGDFAYALAQRYSGHFRDPLNGQRMLPRVSYFQAWNEPNLSIYLNPQWGRTSTGSYVALSPILYRGLLNSFYAAVKRVSRQDKVFAAGLAPFGDPPGTYNGKLSPVTFLEDLFCLNPSLRPAGCPGGVAHLDGLDHHTFSPPWYHASLPADISTPDLGRIWMILHAAQRAHRVLPVGPKPLWITEVGFPAFPVDPSHLALQAHSLALDLYIFWTEGVSRVFWFSIQDPTVDPGDPALDGGLYFQNAVPKPAAAAYHFPFVVVPLSGHVFAVWGKAPRRGRVAIQRLSGNRWVGVRQLTTTRGGIFYMRLRLTGAPLFRAVIGATASPPWTAGGIS